MQRDAECWEEGEGFLVDWYMHLTHKNQNHYAGMYVHINVSSS